MFLLFCDAPARQSLIWLTLVLGVGTDAPSRYSASMASVNSSFLRRSGVRNAEANALSTKSSCAVLLGMEYQPDQVAQATTESLARRSAQANSRGCAAPRVGITAW